MSTFKRLADSLAAEYEKTRQKWNAATTHEERQELGQRLNDIREAEHALAERDWSEPDAPTSTGGEMSSQSIEA